MVVFLDICQFDSMVFFEEFYFLQTNLDLILNRLEFVVFVVKLPLQVIDLQLFFLTTIFFSLGNLLETLDLLLIGLFLIDQIFVFDLNLSLKLCYS